MSLTGRLEEAFTAGSVLSVVSVIVEEKSSQSLVDRLDEVASRELHKNEFKNVTLILKAVEQIISKDEDCINRLVRQGVVIKGLRTSEDAAKAPQCPDAPDGSVLRSIHGNSKILELLLLRFGAVVIDQEVKFDLRLEAIKTINSMLDSASKESRKKICQSDDHNFLLEEFAKVIVDVGVCGELVYSTLNLTKLTGLPAQDYEMQVAISEALCRMTPKKRREEMSGNWFSYKSFASTFTTIRVKEFETDCRIFLNELNSYFGVSRRVFSFPCSRVFLELTEVSKRRLGGSPGNSYVTHKCLLFKPQDELLKEFWVDFNLGTSCISIFVHDPEGTLWELIRLPKEALSSYTLRECDDRKLLSIYMTHQVSHAHKTWSNKKMVQIAFESKHDIQTAVEKVFGGGEKLQLPEAPKHATTEDSGILAENAQKITSTPVTRTTGKTQVSFVFQSGPGKLPSPKGRKIQLEDTFILRNDSDTEVTVSETLNHTFLTDVSHNRKPGTISFMAALWRYQVVRAKAAMFSQSLSSNGSVSSVRSLPSTSSEMKSIQKRKRKSFLSESESEKHLSEQTPLFDYTKKKQRVKSKLKVLPLSSPSSNEDVYKESTPMRRSLERQSAESASRLQSKQDKMSQDISRTSKEVTSDSGFQGRTAYEDTVFMDDHSLSVEEPKVCIEGLPPLGKKTQLLTELQEGAEVTEAQLQREKDSPFFTFKPRRLFPSTSQDTATESMGQTLLDEEESETELGSGVTAAFKTQLREYFSSRYKKIEAKSLQSLTDCQRNVTSLLRKVHNQRLMHLEHFHDTVVQQLGQLEQNCLSLKSIEKETVRFWKSESDTVKAFCAEQQKRLDSIEMMKESVQEPQSQEKSTEATPSGAHPSNSTTASGRTETKES